MNKKRVGITVIAIMIIVLAFCVYRMDQPTQVSPNPDWVASVSGAELRREQFFILSGDIKLEAELIIPAIIAVAIVGCVSKGPSFPTGEFSDGEGHIVNYFGGRKVHS